MITRSKTNSLPKPKQDRNLIQRKKSDHHHHHREKEYTNPINHILTNLHQQKEEEEENKTNVFLYTPTGKKLGSRDGYIAKTIDAIVNELDRTRPSSLVLVYSPGMGFAHSVMELLKKHYDDEEEKKEKKVDTVIGDDLIFNNNTRVKFLPASERHTRGMKADLIICLTCDCMTLPFFVNFILPLSSPASTRLALIGSLVDDDGSELVNWFSKLITECSPSLINKYYLYEN